MKNYGVELILDIHNCNITKFNRKEIEEFMKKLCELIDMEREDLYFWDYEGQEDEYKKAPAHLKGISAVQFISTSNITIHTLDEMKRVYLNVFSCKGFDMNKAAKFCTYYFEGYLLKKQIIDRF